MVALALATTLAGTRVGMPVSSAAARSSAAGDLAPECAVEGVDDRCEKWAATYDDSELNPGGVDTLLAMAVDPTERRVFTLGQSSQSLAVRRAIVAMDATFGDVLWTTKEDGKYPDVSQLAVSHDGKRVYATGGVGVVEREGDGDPLINTAALTTAYDAASGARLWSSRFDLAPVGHRDGKAFDLHSEDTSSAIVASATTDTVYVTGHSDTNDGFYDITVTAYEGATGKQKWTSSYDSSTSSSPYAIDIASPNLAKVSADGTTLYVAGVASGKRIVLGFQADPSGDGRLLWARTVGQAVAYAPTRWLDVAPDGSRYYLFGATLEAFDASTGVKQWEKAGDFGSPSVSRTGDKVFLFDGSRAVHEQKRMVALDASTGLQVWSATLDHLTSPAAVAVSPDGKYVYATGLRTVQQETRAYESATGAVLWRAVYIRNANATRAFLAAVGPSGTVYVGGHVDAPLTNPAVVDPTLKGNAGDWGVVAYDA